VHEAIAFFDEGRHNMPEAGKINAFCASLRQCNRFGAAIQTTRANKAVAHSLLAFTDSLLSFVAAGQDSETTGDMSYAASATASDTITMSRADFEFALAAAVATATKKKKPSSGTSGVTVGGAGSSRSWYCAYHGLNASHDTDACRLKRKIPRALLESTAENPLGGPVLKRHNNLPPAALSA
jgi:hypothetical protein